MSAFASATVEMTGRTAPDDRENSELCAPMLGPYPLCFRPLQTQTLRGACCGANVPINAKYTRRTMHGTSEEAVLATFKCQQRRGFPTRKARSTTAKLGRAIGRQSCGSVAVEDKRAVGPRGQSTRRLRSKQLNRLCTLLLSPLSLVPPAWQTQTLRQACCGANIPTVPINAKYTRRTMHGTSEKAIPAAAKYVNSFAAFRHARRAARQQSLEGPTAVRAVEAWQSRINVPSGHEVNRHRGCDRNN